MGEKTLQVEPETLEEMKTSPYNHEDTRWAVYQNMALDSVNVGHMQFLAVGSQNTFKEPPGRIPDSPAGLGWRYGFIGWVDLESGVVEKAER